VEALNEVSVLPLPVVCNNTQHFDFDADEKFLPIYTYADKQNQKITNLVEFSEVFLSKCKLAEMINRYMVLVQSEQKLMMMRPYQIYAVEEKLHKTK
jgi:type I restriction enzyme R subunit